MATGAHASSPPPSRGGYGVTFRPVSREHLASLLMSSDDLVHDDGSIGSSPYILATARPQSRRSRLSRPLQPPVPALVDLGNWGRSFLRYGYAKQMGLLASARPFSATTPLAGEDTAQVVTTTHIVSCTLEILHPETFDRVLIDLKDAHIADVAFDIILGTDDITTHGLVPDLRAGELHIKSQKATVPMLSPAEVINFDQDRSPGDMLDFLGAFLPTDEFSTRAQIEAAEAQPDLNAEDCAAELAKLLDEGARLKIFDVPDMEMAKVPEAHLQPRPEFKRTVIHQKPRQFSEVETQIIHLLTRDELRRGIIEPTRSAWNTRTFLVPKRECTLAETERAIAAGDVDFLRKHFRKGISPVALNKVTMPISAPIGTAETAADSMLGACFFSSIDLHTSYQQIGLGAKWRERTAFTVPKMGKFQFTRLAYGLMNAGFFLSAEMLHSLPPELIYAYIKQFIDDLLAHTKTRRAHLLVLRNIFLWAQRFNFKINRDKCIFLATEIEWCGRLYSKDGVRPTPAKIDAILAMPHPRDFEGNRAQHLLRFLQTANWHLRPFWPLWGHVSAPLWELANTAKKGDFQWTEKHEEAWVRIQQMQVSRLRNSFFDPSRPSRVVSDAARDRDRAAIAATLYQQDDDGNWVLIQSVCRKLTPAETRYSATEVELLAHVFAKESFRRYLALRRDTIFVTDHKALPPLLAKIDHENTRLQRLALKTYSCGGVLVYEPGCSNTADYWTRILSRDFPTDVVVGIDLVDQRLFTSYATISDILDQPRRAPGAPAPATATAAPPLAAFAGIKRLRIIPAPAVRRTPFYTSMFFDDWILAVSDKELTLLRATYKEANVRRGKLGYEIRHKGEWFLYPPARLRYHVLADAHTEVHLSYNAMSKNLRRFRWPNKKVTIRQYLLGCSCSFHKRAPSARKKDGHITANYALEKVCLDVYSLGSLSYLTMMDVFSGMLWLSYLTTKQAPQVLAAFLSLLGTLPVCPITILLTDNGGEFSRTVEARYSCQLSTADLHLFSMFTFTAILKTASYMPNANGKLERIHQELSKLARIHSLHPHHVLHLVNTPAIRTLFFASAHDAAARFTAFRAEAPTDDDQTLLRAWRSARRGRQIADDPDDVSEHVKDTPPAYTVGDSVLFRRQDRSRAKYDPMWDGPYQVTSRCGKTTYMVDNFYRGRGHGNPRKLDTDRMKLFIPPVLTQYTFDTRFLIDTFCLPQSTTLPSTPLADLLLTPWRDRIIFVGLLCNEWAAVLEHARAHAPNQVLGFIPTTKGIRAVQRALDARTDDPATCSQVLTRPIELSDLTGALYDWAGRSVKPPSFDYLSFASIHLFFQEAPKAPPADAASPPAADSVLAEPGAPDSA